MMLTTVSAERSKEECSSCVFFPNNTSKTLFGTFSSRVLKLPLPLNSHVHPGVVVTQKLYHAYSSAMYIQSTCGEANDFLN